ncbi:hypothetical protein MTR67_017545 [Solanum verrucosum]|uniref:Uncharacterized protein n=1 Tax=Solanum verrucosum TaxID=315347 RepID=A0AAF0TSB4_SOLVR|nr:hypothetical protein MTR67_017545 [Solanum verrucosum]
MDPTGNKFEQEVVYGWKPKFCPKCSMVGHTCPKQIPQPQAPQPRKRQDPSIGGKECKPTGVIREPASDVPESFKQNQVRTTPTQSEMENVAQHEASPKALLETRVKVHKAPKRKELWAELVLIEQGVDKPWIIAGDFNVVLYPNDWLYGAPISLAETQDFSNCLHTLQLNELSWKGDYYTWSNKQFGVDRICSRIDRVFGNLEWIMTWGHVSTKYDLPYFFDHSPMLLTVADNQWTYKVPFRFSNIWSEHNTFMDKVTEIWHKHRASGKMANIWAKLRALRQVLKILNNEEFKNTTTKVNAARQELIQVQKQIIQQCTDELLCKEKQTMLDIKKWSLVEESALRQKSRAK